MIDADFYDSIAASYESAFSTDPGLLSFVDLALTLLPPKSHVLDAGCGTGNPVATSLEAAGHHVTGIDISNAMIELSRKAVPSGHFEVADMRSYEPKEKLNAVFTILSLFVLDREEIEAMAGRWSKWLDTGGLLYICTLPAEDMDPKGRGKEFDADGKCVRDLETRFMGKMVPITLFTRDGWKSLLRANGFKILATATEVYVPPKECETDDEPHYFIVARKEAQE